MKTDKNGYLDISDIKFPKGCPKISNLEPPILYEIAISFFEKCNLRCKFCFQEHAKGYDRHFVEILPDKLQPEIARILEKYPSIQQFNILMMGGELFADNIPEDMFQEYYTFCRSMQEIFEVYFPGVRLHFVVGTNGVYKARMRVLDFLYKFDVETCVSYDPIGRHPSPEIAKMARDTIKAFHLINGPVTISSVLTKRNIHEVMTNPDYLKWLHSEYVSRVDLNWYIGNPNWEEDLPTDDELAEFFKWCIDNKLYKIKLIDLLFQGILEGTRDRLCDCKFLLGVGQDKWTRNCIEHYSIFENKLFYGDFSDEITEENVSDVKTSLGVLKRGCLSCEYYENCQMPCWCSVLFEKFVPGVCPLKQAYQYINNNHIEDYKQWSNLHG